MYDIWRATTEKKPKPGDYDLQNEAAPSAWSRQQRRGRPLLQAIASHYNLNHANPGRQMVLLLRYDSKNFAALKAVFGT